jgi:hypothetical protein
LNEKGLMTLRNGITLDALQRLAGAKTDLVAAQEMQRAKSDLFASFAKQKRSA